MYVVSWRCFLCSGCEFLIWFIFMLILFHYFKSLFTCQETNIMFRTKKNDVKVIASLIKKAKYKQFKFMGNENFYALAVLEATVKRLQLDLEHLRNKK